LRQRDLHSCCKSSAIAFADRPLYQADRKELEQMTSHDIGTTTELFRRKTVFHRFARGILATLILAAGCSIARADDGASATLDKAIKALGGEDALSKVKAISLKGKGTVNIMGNESPISASVTMQGLDHSKQEVEVEFNGMKIKFVAVLAGDKGWRSFAGMTAELEGDALNEAKRSQYLQVMVMNPTILKGKGFKVVAAPAEKVGDKNALGLKITGPDGKTSTLYVDEASGLPVKMVAKVKDPMGEEFTQTSIYSNYKDFQGIKKATKMEASRDGEKFQSQEVTEFKVLDSVDPKTFAEPKE
jgi:hypothetical protein